MDAFLGSFPAETRRGTEVHRVGGGYAYTSSRPNSRPTSPNKNLEDKLSRLEAQLQALREQNRALTQARAALQAEVLEAKRFGEDRLSRLEAQLQAMTEQNRALNAELAQKISMQDAQAQARAALQAEVLEAKRFGDSFAAELERIKANYSSVESIHASEVSGLRAALEATGALCEQQRREAEIAHAEHSAREKEHTRRWDEEREALARGHEAECEALRSGWQKQSEKLAREVAAEKARADGLQASLDDLRRSQSAERQRRLLQ